MIKGRAVLLLLILVLPQILLASIHEPQFNPNLDIKKINKDIKVDGIIDDSEWSFASNIVNFTERNPGDNISPLVNTEAYIAYTDDKLYIGFKCFDDPALIRASMTQRDQYSGDDEVAVYIDTYGDASIAYEFYVNPFGIQKDLLWNPITGGDIGYDLIWESSAIITDFGYEVEMAIPFSSLRFPNKDVQTWKIDFRRNHPRETNHEYSWAALDRNEQCGPCQWGTLSGINSVLPGKGIEILPSIVGSQNSEFTDNKLVNDNPDGEVALTGKYALSSDVTVEGSINPDFSQIEADAAQIDVNSTTSLYFPERRPFFQEGADIFLTMFNSFYSRMIQDPEYAVKMTGRPGKSRFGLISAYDNNSTYIIPLEETDLAFKASKSYVNIFRGIKTVGNNSRVGFIINDRRYEKEGSNSVFSVDGDFSLSSNFRADAQYIYTYTKEGKSDVLDRVVDSVYNPSTGTYTDVIDTLWYDNHSYTLNFDNEAYGGSAFIGRIRHASRHVFAQIGYNQIQPSYRTLTGYDPLNNHRSSDSYIQYTFYPKNSIFERIVPQFSTFNRWHYRTGQKKISNYSIGLNGNLRYAQTNIFISYDRSFELYNNIEYDRLNSYHFNFNSQPTKAFGYYLGVRYGDGIARFAGVPSDEIAIESGLDIKPYDNVLIEPDIHYIKGTDKVTDINLYQQFNLRTRIQYQVNRKLSVRLVTQFVDRKIFETNNKSLDIDPLFTYRLNPFTVFYLGSTNSYSDYLPYDNQEFQLNQRKFFFKLQYLFQT